MLDTLTKEAIEVTEELCEKAKLKAGQIVVVGCSSSEIAGERVGSASSPELAEAVFCGIQEVLAKKGIFLAAQCCEHLNRALIIESDAAERYMLDPVNVVPKPKAGGSFATAAYSHFENPVAVEHVRAHAGLDIGGTLIGMHLREVAVPLRLSKPKLGEAILLAARTRPKFVGGGRAVYNEDLM